jgi:hypothetical protein
MQEPGMWNVSMNAKPAAVPHGLQFTPDRRAVGLAAAWNKNRPTHMRKPTPRTARAAQRMLDVVEDLKSNGPCGRI